MTYNPEKILDHVDQAQAKLLEQFQDKPLLLALLASYIRRIQRLENAVWEVIEIRGIDASEGVGLDAIGVIVGRPRLGLEDIEYRISLKAQIRINRSSGTPEDMIDVTTLSLPDGFDFTYQEFYPATIWIDIIDVITVNPLVIFDNLTRAKPGGVRLIFSYSTDEDAFTFSDDNPTASTTQGFADDISGNTGGFLIDVFQK